jgi:hypothetical protein
MATKTKGEKKRTKSSKTTGKMTTARKKISAERRTPVTASIEILNPEKPKRVAFIVSNASVSKQTGWPLRERLQYASA